MDPKRGEIWLVNLDPTVGAEIKKTRPALVVRSHALPRLPLCLIAPLTERKAHFEPNFSHLPLLPTSQNGLTKRSAVDLLQLRGVDLRRFVQHLGFLSAAVMEEIAAAAAAVVEYQ